MTLKRHMLKSPIRTCTRNCWSFCQSQPQYASTFAAPKRRLPDGSYEIAPAFVDMVTPLEQRREPAVAGPLMIQKDARRTNRTDHTKFM